ncbi:hypothetical protein GCM10023085_36710 [Actinomadura viridis]|uniref:Tetratricopeptide repeat protein n=1 Tax=Actinomadura viridis TaxID=58110 RepID=A0A931DB33_9ACTN|nr:hypothetical protein [Actinomadura viridis]MBG6087794.1 hypothetical protein [Actinomadura viridis]
MSRTTTRIPQLPPGGEVEILHEVDERIAQAGAEAFTEARGPDGVGSASLRLAEHSLQEGDLRQALRLFERAMDTGHPLHAPKGAAAVALMFSIEAGRTGARTAIGRLAEIGHGDLCPRAWFFYGMYLVRRGDLGEADAVWRSISADGDGGAYAAALSVLNVLGGEPARAEEVFAYLLARDDDLAEEVVWAVLELGNSLAGGHRTREAGRRAHEAGLRMAERSGDPELAEDYRLALRPA